MTCLHRSFWGRVAHVMAVLMLVVSGGLYVHAGPAAHDHDHHEQLLAQASGAVALQPYSHVDVSDDEPGPALAKLHCGADIHFPAAQTSVLSSSVRQVLCPGEPDVPGNPVFSRDPPPPRFIS